MSCSVDDQTAKALLGKGGSVLALAAVAHARGRAAGREKWNVLSPQWAAAAEQVLMIIEGGVDPGFLDAALRRAMDGEPVTAVPGWARPLADGGRVIDEIGRVVGDALIAPALASSVRLEDARERGLAALAVAFCRSRDTLFALSAALPEGERPKVAAMTRLAQATILAGEPSRARSELKRILKEIRDGQSS